MPIPSLRPPTRYAGDPDGPFSGDGSLRVLIDYPPNLRRSETGKWQGNSAPAPEELLWSLCAYDQIEAFWLGTSTDTGEGVIQILPADPDGDYLPFKVTGADGSESFRAISAYQQLTQRVVEDATTTMRAQIQIGLCHSLRAHVIVTEDSRLESLSGRYCNPLNTFDALAVVGLFLRNEHSTLVAMTGSASFRMDTHSLGWCAVRAQLPSGWRWGSALVDHSTSTGDDYGTLLFGSFFERLVRALNYRDALHRATLRRANNQACDEATEALDNMMFNIVGAFDASAIAAHIGAGLSWADRRLARWQSKDWRKELGVRQLNELFYRKTTADDVFSICRTLRNTVHGAGMNSVVSSRNGQQRTLVRLPQSESPDLIERLGRLAPFKNWENRIFIDGSVYIDPARLVEGLLPHILATLEEILANTPLYGLARSREHLKEAPVDGGFDLRTRARASLLYGLPVPKQ